MPIFETAVFSDNFSEERKNDIRKKILEKSKLLDISLINRKTIRESPDLFGGTEDTIVRIFGTIGKFKEMLGGKSYYKTEKDHVEAVKLVAEKLGTTKIPRTAYNANRRPDDPSPTAQMKFMSTHGIEGYKALIEYCLNHDGNYSDQNSSGNRAAMTDEIAQKIHEMHSSGHYDKEISKAVGVSEGVVSRFRKKHDLKNNYNEDLKRLYDD